MPLFKQDQSLPSQPTSSTAGQTQIVSQTQTEPTIAQEISNSGKTITADSLIKGRLNTDSISNTSQSISDGGKGNAIAIAQEMRFLSVKYRVYSVIVISIILLTYNPILSALQDTQTRWNSLSGLDDKINSTIKKEQEYKKEQILFNEITKDKDILINCINKQSSCDQLPDNITKDIDAVRAYLQLGNLNKTKMDIDESKILKNINEFITQKDILSEKRNYNGIVSAINIGHSESLENNIIKVPVSLKVTFNSKQNLLSFLTNIENYIFVEGQNNLDYSILFRIDSLQYDIVNYRESQNVTISLYAYAYKGK